MRKFLAFCTVLMGLWCGAAFGAPSVSVVLVGDRQDVVFSDSMMPGIARVRQELGLAVHILEARFDPKRFDVLMDQAARSSQLVIAVGWPLQKALEQAARRYGSVHFVLLDAYSEEPQVTSVVFKQNEGAYLAGALGAHMATRGWNGKIRWSPSDGKPPVIGALIAQTYPAGGDFLAGYVQGAKSVRGDIQVLAEGPRDWDDMEGAGELARRLHEKGAGVIVQACGPAGRAVIDAAIGGGFYVIAVDGPQERLAPGVVLTSVLKRLDVAAWNVISDFQEGRLRKGSVIQYGLRENCVDLSWTSNALIPPFVKDRLDALKRQIAGGQIVVDSAFTGLPLAGPQ